MQKARLADVPQDVHGLISKRTADLDGVSVTEVTFGVGARWSNDLKDYAGTELCQSSPPVTSCSCLLATTRGRLALRRASSSSSLVAAIATVATEVRGIDQAGKVLDSSVAIDDLFTPLSVRSLTVPNRFAMAPMTRQASPGGVPGADVAEYYRRRAAGGVGLIITEGVRLPDPAAGYPSAIPTLAGDDVLAGWGRVVEAVHAEGGTVAAQLWHQGVQRDDADGVVPVGPSGVDGLGAPRGRALATDELPQLSQLYADSAATAREVGFDAVELHGAHGYLLDEFLWERTNLRTDGYGGSLAARTRFPADVVAAVRGAVGPDYPIIFRFSQWKGTDYAASIADDPTQLRELLAPLVEAGVDVLHPSTRRHYAPAFPDVDHERSLAGWTKKVTGLPVIAVGSVGLETQFRSEKQGQVIQPAPLDRLVEQFAAGEFDVVAIGRALLADPAWVNRLRNGELAAFAGYNPETALSALH